MQEEVIGALTSKPYAFKVRPWEVASYESIDLLDCFGSNIRIDLYGDEVVRILPSIRAELNEEWITNKVRFCYDGLRIQRNRTPLAYIDKQYHLRVSWETSMHMILNKLLEYENRYLLDYGNLVDLETITLLKQVDLLQGSRLKRAGSGELRANYLSTVCIRELELVEEFILLCEDVRKVVPLIEIKLKRKLRQGAAIGSVGTGLRERGVVGLGTDIRGVQAILEGRNKFLRSLSNASAVVVGEEMLHMEYIQEGLSVLKTFIGLAQCMVYTGVGVLQGKELGYGTVSAKGYGQVCYIVNNDDYEFCVGLGEERESGYFIYQGHHGERSMWHAHQTLPCSTYFEREGTYVNMEGRVQGVSASFQPPYKSRVDWKIVRVLGGSLSYFHEKVAHTLEEVRLRIQEETPIKKRPNVLGSVTKVGVTSRVGNVRLTDYITYYYSTDIISRGSRILSMARLIELEKLESSL